MRRLYYLVALSILALLVFVPAALAWQNQQQSAIGNSAPNSRSVSIEDFYFEPSEAAIQPGDTVTWTNEGNHPHTVTADDGSFDSGPLQQGESFSHTFQSPGMVSYYCSIHPFMTGSVSVGKGGGGVAPSTSQPSMPASPMSMGSGY